MSASARPRFSGLGLLCAVAGLFLGCDSPTSPREGDLRISVAVSSQQFAVGDTVEIRVTVTNVTPRYVVYHTGGCPYSMRLVSATESYLVVGPTCFGLSKRNGLEPGGQATFLREFTGEVYPVTGGTETLEVPPGVYDLEVELRAVEVRPRAAPVPVEITPAEP